MRALGAPPVDIAAAPPCGRLLALGRLPAGVYQRLRISFGGGRESGYLVRAGEPKLPLAGAASSLELRLPDLTLAAGEMRFLTLTLDTDKLTPAAGKVIIPAAALVLAEPPQETLASIAGSIVPAAATATVQACLAATGDVLAQAPSDPETGKFTLTRLPPGEYYLAVMAQGFRPHADRTRSLAAQPAAVTQAEPVVLAASGGQVAVE